MNRPINTLAVPAYLSFDPGAMNFRGQPGIKIGSGEAGHTVFLFADPVAALDFANSLPAQSRMPAHDLAVASIKAVLAAERCKGEAMGATVEYQGDPRGWPVHIYKDGRQIVPPCRY